MGIKGLADFLRKKNPNLFQKIQHSDLAGKTLAVDLPIIAYKLSYSITTNPRQGQHSDPKQALADSVIDFYHRMMRNYSIKCIFVFDGPTCSAKSAETRRRVKAAEQNAQRQSKITADLTEKLMLVTQRSKKLELYMDNPELNPLKISDVVGEPSFCMEGVINGSEVVLKTPCPPPFTLETLETQKKELTEQLSKKFFTRVGYSDYTYMVKQLQKLDIPFCIAEADAERTCAFMVESGVAYASATDDYDALPCGTPIVVRNLLSSSMPLEIVKLQDVLLQLEMNRLQFVDMCVLSGSDFTEHIPKMGTATAFAAIKKHGSIESFIEKDAKGVEIPYKFTNFAEQFNYLEARQRFLEGGCAWWGNFKEDFIMLD